jgi:hypothetical protein
MHRTLPAFARLRLRCGRFRAAFTAALLRAVMIPRQLSTGLSFIHTAVARNELSSMLLV